MPTSKSNNKQTGAKKMEARYLNAKTGKEVLAFAKVLEFSVLRV
jgi:hypothetical protein